MIVWVLGRWKYGLLDGRVGGDFGSGYISV